MLKTPLFALFTLTASLSFTAGAFAQVTVNGAAANLSQPAEASSTDKTDSADINDKDIYCPTAEEPILPGEYYACEARSAYGHENYRKMVEMLEEAAYWANKDAQYSLGLAYFNGDIPQVPQNIPLGLAWLALAAERKDGQYVLAYAGAHARATPKDIREAAALWKTMKPKYGDSVAAPRAIRRFNHGIQDIDDAARENGIVYLHGFAPYGQSALAVSNKLHDQAAADFENFHGSVVVGKPAWVKDDPANATSAAKAAPAAASSTSTSTNPSGESAWDKVR